MRCHIVTEGPRVQGRTRPAATPHGRVESLVAMPILRALTVILAAALAVAGMAARALADGAAPGLGAVVFAYNRVGEDRTPGNSIRVDQFEAHLEELTSGGYTVLPLPQIVEALRNGSLLPDRTIAITIDEASRSFYREAWPRLREAGLPFTLFVGTDALDRGSPAHMSWDELRQIAATSAVTIATLGASAQPAALRPVADVEAELRRGVSRLQTELGQRPTLYAYPFGEMSAALRELVAAQGFAAAFGQQSGVAYPGEDRWALPRFVMNEAFGGTERFRLAAGALPLPVSEQTPEDPLITVNPPPIGFTVDRDIGDLSRLACFASGQGRTALERFDEGRVEVRIAAPLPPGRPRINCTLPTLDGRWRWYGVQLVVPETP